MSDDNGLVEALLGLKGFKVLGVAETEAEVTIRIETTASVVACDGCGLRAEAQDRMVVQYRDLAAFGRPARLMWLYPSEWGVRVLMRGGGGRVAGQLMPPVWSRTRSR